jgi:MoaA/NifB/PqqE/SkfB family radical SAM enzyme
MHRDAELAASLQQDRPTLSFLWLEITGRCNLRCIHCYADSGPGGQPDNVGTERWLSLLNEAAALDVEWVQFIGGEPTVHPEFKRLFLSAKQLGLEVEVYTNLTHISKDLWRIFQDERVHLATSFYSYHEASHEMVTMGKGSQKRTLANIERAIELELPVRVGIVGVREDQDIAGTVNYLRGLGVSEIRVDWSRGVGRGATQPSSDASTDELCGRCADGKLAIQPDGWVYPCVFARWLPVGNVRGSSLEQIAISAHLTKVREDLAASFTRRAKENHQASELVPVGLGGCEPDACGPHCHPGHCHPHHSPPPCLPQNGIP